MGIKSPSPRRLQRVGFILSISCLRQTSAMRKFIDVNLILMLKTGIKSASIVALSVLLTLVHFRHF